MIINWKIRKKLRNQIEKKKFYHLIRNYLNRLILKRIYKNRMIKINKNQMIRNKIQNDKYKNKIVMFKLMIKK